MDVELRHLRAFEAVARLQSFTHAATEIAITQPALSRTIRQLETAMRVTLLDRSSRHVEVTAVGRRFLGDVERILTDLDRAVATVREQVSLRLGFSWLLPDPWAQDAVARFERATGSAVSLVRSDDPLTAVQQNKIDVALVRGRVRSSTWRVVHLFDEQRVALCSVHSALADQDRLDWADVPRWPLVVNIVSGTTGPWSWPAGHGPEKVVETTNFDEWLESIAADRGIGVVPEVAMRRNIHPAVKFLPLDHAPSIPVSLVFLPNGQDALLRRFVEASMDATPTAAPGTARPEARPSPSSRSRPRR
ncbi:LysR family transcriptional regulator [Pseudonocardia sp. GCM10023141]|uniref:LysR family transcriptional regulator n=1 Tax=Pseudonocardia sp. GCM10023141 TaxID=3252653 RepID=UPI0036122E8B